MEVRAFLLHDPCSYTGDNELVVKKFVYNRICWLVMLFYAASYFQVEQPEIKSSTKNFIGL